MSTLRRCKHWSHHPHIKAWIALQGSRIKYFSLPDRDHLKTLSEILYILQVGMIEFMIVSEGLVFKAVLSRFWRQALSCVTWRFDEITAISFNGKDFSDSRFRQKRREYQEDESQLFLWNSMPGIQYKSFNGYIVFFSQNIYYWHYSASWNISIIFFHHVTYFYSKSCYFGYKIFFWWQYQSY